MHTTETDLALVGRDNVFVSIFESNSVDSTKPLLSTLNDSLSNLNVNHRIITNDDEARHWPYPQSRERIEYLANARNKAMEPLQSPDPTVRLENWNEYTTVVFLNDAWFSWEDVVRLIATETEDGGDYDLACGMDFGWLTERVGLYDTWVARDICGTPLRPFFPYVKDPVSARKVRDEQPFAVSACWNGMVAFPSGPFLCSLASPPLVTPLQFHPSPFQACDHSECFLMSYDLHRLYNTTERPARIVMNPQVRVAYEQNWWKWQNVVLRVPIIRFWVGKLEFLFPCCRIGEREGGRWL
ncbi:cryptococcal mannosyltransferase 1-domain-containing protein [Naematelia encephala]|uniref:Cryptococcal mannosyltransferase 1-domain-containing protein n=1 Tax=Naematelia encephala TaxID=71784 RepID=A0A1Y2BKN0_9TREE|nr:cryptococcal mannosyltransferase 1-domain-containing protein [Naematelia encephala]